MASSDLGTMFRVYREWYKKIYPMSSVSLGENALLTSEI